jgi:hypothetical protein
MKLFIFYFCVDSASFQSPRSEVECRLALEREKEELEGQLTSLTHQLQHMEQQIQEERNLHTKQIEVTAFPSHF